VNYTLLGKALNLAARASGVTAVQLAADTGVSLHTTGKALARLCRHGLVTRTQAETNKVQSPGRAAYIYFYKGGTANETETCIYCDAEVPSRPVPDADNDTAWGIEALDHNPGCEWVVTRAHRIEEA
jgi:hypothetical protein